MYIFRPNLRTDEIFEELRPVLDSGWVGLGPKVTEFESQLGEYLDNKNVVATNSCTSSLHMAVRFLGLKPGTRVLTTALTFVSTNHVLLWENLTPVFCDVNPRTGCLDPLSIKEALAKYDNVGAIMVVHLGGYPADMNEINEIAAENNIAVIEDCAHALGAIYNGKKLSAGNNICAWSFQAVKNMPMGDGGAISFPDASLIEDACAMRWMGIDKSTIARTSGGYKWEYNIPSMGYKYYMNDITAAIGCVQLRHLDNDNLRRRQIAEIYQQNLSSFCPEYSQDRESSYHFYPLFFSNRNEVYQHLVDNEIYPGMHYRMNTRYSMYENCERISGLINSHWYEESAITLPIHTMLTDEDVMRVCDTVKEVAK